MSVARQTDWISPEEYLEGELLSQIKHEYIDGQVYAMSGVSTPHGLIAGNFYTVVRAHLRGTPCRAFISDMKVQIPARNVYYYPDILVTCDERDRANNYFKEHPCLIIEVLSPKTALFDREGKFLDYQKLELLQEYVLVSQDLMRVEVYRRQQANVWEYSIHIADGEISFKSINLSVPIEQIYEDVDFPEASVDERPAASQEEAPATPPVRS